MPHPPNRARWLIHGASPWRSRTRARSSATSPATTGGRSHSRSARCGCAACCKRGSEPSASCAMTSQTTQPFLLNLRHPSPPRPCPNLPPSPGSTGTFRPRSHTRNTARGLDNAGTPPPPSGPRCFAGRADRHRQGWGHRHYSLSKAGVPYLPSGWHCPYHAQFRAPHFQGRHRGSRPGDRFSTASESSRE